MDDGSKKGNSVILCTDALSIKDVEVLAKMLTDLYGLKTSLQNNRTNRRIYVASESYSTFKFLVDEYVLNSMKYKLP